MGRILRKIGPLLAFFCIGTMMTQALGLAYLFSNGYLDKPKLIRMMAVAHEIDLDAIHKEGQVELDEDSTEQPSYEDIEEFRALKGLDLDLRMQTIETGLKQMKFLEAELKKSRERYDLVRNSFQEELDSMRTKATTGGIAEVQRTLESIKPKQAKEQILRMVETGDIREVVTMLSAMEDAKRAKIFGEFKTEEDAKTMSEILKQIRTGGEDLKLIDQTLNQLDRVNPSGT